MTGSQRSVDPVEPVEPRGNLLPACRASPERRATLARDDFAPAQVGRQADDARPDPAIADSADDVLHVPPRARHDDLRARCVGQPVENRGAPRVERPGPVARRAHPLLRHEHPVDVEKHDRPFVDGKEELVAHHAVDAFEIEVLTHQAAARHHEMEVTFVACALRRRLRGDRVSRGEVTFGDGNVTNDTGR